MSLRQARFIRVSSRRILTSVFTEKIKSFLSSFKVSKEDVMGGFADLDLDDDVAHTETSFSGLKYMSQLASYFKYLRSCSVLIRKLQQKVANRDQQMLVIDLEDIAEVSTQTELMLTVG